MMKEKLNLFMCDPLCKTPAIQQGLALQGHMQGGGPMWHAQLCQQACQRAASHGAPSSTAGGLELLGQACQVWNHRQQACPDLQLTSGIGTCFLHAMLSFEYC